MSIDYATSWDSPSPTTGWGSLVPFGIFGGGRYGLCAGFGAINAPGRAIPAGGAYVGFAYWTQALANDIMNLTGNWVQNGHLRHLGDGRLQVFIGAFNIGDVWDVPRLVITTNKWYYMEYRQQISFFGVVDNGDGTSTVHLVISFEVRCNNRSYLVDAFDHVFIWPNPVPSPDITALTLGAPGGGLAAFNDDLYIENATFLGDSKVTYDSGSGLEVVTQEITQPRVTQQLVEIGVLPDPSLIRITQQLVELGVLAQPPENRVRLTQQLVEIGILPGSALRIIPKFLKW